jgi:group I intron endonuclease
MATGDSITSQSGIYQIRCTVNDKLYIGKALNLSKRWKDHQRSLERGVHHSPALQRAWLKYGAECFVFEVLQIVPRSDLTRVEQEYLDRFQPFGQAGFNTCRTSGSTLGTTPTLETRAKIAASITGYKHTPQAKANMSVSQTGHEVTLATRAKLAEVRRALPPPPKLTGEALAKKVAHAIQYFSPPDVRARSVATRTGRKHRPDTLAKMSVSQTGHEVTLATRAKLAANNGARQPGARAKMSATRKGLWTPKMEAKLLAGRLRYYQRMRTFCFSDGEA